MTYHLWSDQWFQKHGNDLNEAMNYIYTYVHRRTGCYVAMKEKYGTIRYEWVLPPGGRFANIYRIKLPWLKRKLILTNSTTGKKTEYKYPYFLFRWDVCNWFYRKWTALGMWALKRAVNSACKKWPEIAEEIREDTWGWD